jgi:outer membrane biosynthesis protein TonB
MKGTISMKVHSPFSLRTVVAMLCGVGFAVGVVAFHAQADQWDKKTILTVDQPIQVTERVLEPGQYVLKLADSNSDRHIVQIFNGDQTRIIDTVLAVPNYRLQPTGNSRFAFWETPPGNAKALRAWFYPGDNFGQEFRYPKHLAMLASTAPAPPLQEPSTAAPPQPEPTPQPQAMTPEPQQQKLPEEIAQNSPPPTPEAAPQTQPHEEQTPERLPKTASPYPLIGLIGLLLLGLHGVLRLRRSA